MNHQDYIAAIRSAVCLGSGGWSHLPELGHGADFAKGSTTIAAYRGGDVGVDHHTPAVKDSTWRVPVTLYYAQREGSGSAEVASTVRTQLDSMAQWACDASNYPSPPAGLLRVEIDGGPYVGPTDDLEAWFEQTGQNWVGGSVDLVATVMLPFAGGSPGGSAPVTALPILQAIAAGTLPEYANNAAAVAGGLTNGMFYRTADAVKVVHP